MAKNTAKQTKSDLKHPCLKDLLPQKTKIHANILKTPSPLS